MLKLTSCFVVLLCLENVIAWGGWQNLEGGVVSVAGASWGPKRIDAYAAAADGSVWHKFYSNNVWGSNWENIGGKADYKIAAFAIKPNWTDIMYTGSDHILYRKSWDGQKWIDWKKSANGGYFLSGPTMAAGNQADLHVFAFGMDKQLYHCVVNVNNDQWSNWDLLPGNTFVGDPAAVSWNAARFDVFAIGTDSKLYQKTYDGKWLDWSVVPSSGLYKPGVGATSLGPGSIIVVTRGMDDAAYSQVYDNSWGKPESMGGGIISSPSATTSYSKRVDAFVVGSDGKVYHNIMDSKDAPTNYGCHKGSCWSKCRESVVAAIAAFEWCYTTKGISQDYHYVSCKTWEACVNDWHCAGPCSV